MSGLEDIQIGIDIADERQFQALSREPRALERTFTPRELAECRSRDEDAGPALLRRFAAKEALIKACGQPEGHLARIEILHDNDGRPIVHWDHLTQKGLSARISVSSAPPYAIAVAIVGPICSKNMLAQSLEAGR